MFDNPLPTMAPCYTPLAKRGDVMLDDLYSRLYVVLGSRWDKRLCMWQYRVLILACWFEAFDETGKIFEFGDGIVEDTMMGWVELPSNM